MISSFSQSLERFFLIVGQNDFGNKIRFALNITYIHIAIAKAILPIIKSHSSTALMNPDSINRRTRSWRSKNQGKHHFCTFTLSLIKSIDKVNLETFHSLANRV